MTREEAITALSDRNILLFGTSKEERKYYSEALDMAISALSTEGEYIRKKDIINECISYADHENNVKFKKEVSERRKHDSEVIIYACEHFRKFVNGLQSYSFPDREKGEWIPVSERLPEKNTRCLVAVGLFNLTQIATYSNLMGTIDHRIFYQGDYRRENFEDITEYVKAWQPLPEPYKAESEVKPND